MSYLSESQCKEIAATVSIYPVSSEEIGDISQYSFDCGEAKEYVTFLQEKARELDDLCISKTFVILHNDTKELIGYFTLSADSVRLTSEEKNETDLSEVKFLSLPAVKLGKLAINKKLSKEATRKGYGSFVLEIVDTYAFEVNESGVACRFVTVDADIEYDPKTPEFYEKNGFVKNLSKEIKSPSKTVSMRRDINS